MISLKTFHIFFIVISITLLTGYGVYEINNPSLNGSLSFLPTILSFITVVGLILYCKNVIQKFKIL